jgi:2-polyprenyl-3-methyl-5-hydroxy-6-metoxy-1,4-benzoquinol methylase
MTTTMTSHGAEIAAGERFAFGKNWASFLNVLDENRITTAIKSLQNMLGVQSLAGRSFLDIGSGSGLFSLAARRLGAKVRSFDYDPSSVACTAELRRRYFPDDDQWIVEEGSALDAEYLRRLGHFDIVYSWGVLHHTGDMWRALSYVPDLVAPGGRLWLALYNDQGGWSKRWLVIKRTYNSLPTFLRPLFAVIVYTPRELRSFVGNLVRGQLGTYFRYIWCYATVSARGMSWWHDRVDWIGGYPFEVARPEQVFDLYIDKGFQLVKLRTCGGGLGCNEFVFEKR